MYQLFNQKQERINGFSYNESERLKWVKEKLGGQEPGTELLDVGSGEQPFRDYCDHLVYYSQDYGEYDGVGDGSSLQTKSWDYGSLNYKGDICTLDFEGKLFDTILCTEVLEHLPDPVKAIEKLKSLLKVGGEVIITVPFASLTHFAPYHYCTGMNRFFFEAHFKGFEIIELRQNGNYYKFLIQELSRLPSISEKYSTTCLSKREIEDIEKVKRTLSNLPDENPELEQLLSFGTFFHAKKK